MFYERRKMASDPGELPALLRVGFAADQDVEMGEPAVDPEGDRPTRSAGSRARQGSPEWGQLKATVRLQQLRPTLDFDACGCPISNRLRFVGVIISPARSHGCVTSLYGARRYTMQSVRTEHICNGRDPIARPIRCDGVSKKSGKAARDKPF